jgi:hypothetical protein
MLRRRETRLVGSSSLAPLVPNRRYHPLWQSQKDFLPKRMIGVEYGSGLWTVVCEHSQLSMEHGKIHIGPIWIQRDFPDLPHGTFNCRPTPASITGRRNYRDGSVAQ